MIDSKTGTENIKDDPGVSSRARKQGSANIYTHTAQDGGVSK
jgi:hypothetical protein